MCSSCAKKAALRNARVVARSIKVVKKIKSKSQPEIKDNENTEPQNDGESEIS